MKGCLYMVRRIYENKKNSKKSIEEARIGRTKEVKVLQGNWGYGWDDLCEYDKYDNGECKNDLKAYRENDPSASYRVIFRRVPNKDYVPTESIKRNKRVKEDFTVTDSDYCRDIAEEVANVMQDMDWQDSLDDSYDNPDEAWDAYVDQVLEQLESDPQEVIDWLEDEEGSDVHRSLIRNIIKCFGGSVSESVKKKSRKSLKENLDGVDGFAVDIHDMGKGYHHLLLFTDKDTAESAYNGLAECEEYADNGVDDDGYEYDEYALDDGINQISGMADEIVNEVDMRREVDRNDIWTAADDTRYQIIGSVDLWIYW
jgi:hypothetical protein